jgi:hypothetical protein
VPGAAWQAARGRDRARQYANRQITAGLARVVKQPQARVGRHGAHGPSDSGLAGMEWSVLFGHGFSRQESQGLAFLSMEGTAGMVRRVAYRPGAIWQAALRWARIPRFPMARQARHLTQMQGGDVTAGSAASGLASNGWHGRNGTQRLDPSLQATKRSASLGLLWLGRQRSAAQEPAAHGTAGNAAQYRDTLSRQAPHDTEHSAPKAGKVWPLWKASNGRPGLDGQAMRGRSGRHVAAGVAVRGCT